MSLFTVENAKSHTILELIYQLSTEVENHTTIIEQLKNEEKDDIQKAIDYLIQSGQLDEIVGRSIENEIFKGKDLNHPPYRMDRQPKRTFDDAAVLTITNTGQPAEVFGVRSLEQLADIDSRDGVLTFTMYTGPKADVLVATGYTNNSVQVATLGGLDVCPGDIIDVMPPGSYEGQYDVSQRMSSLVSHVDKEHNIIFVQGWYSPNNHSHNQVPNHTIQSHVLINPITKIWNHNSIAVIGEESLATSGVICEYALINSKGVYEHRLSGVDVVNFAGHNEACFVARSTQAFDVPSLMNYGYLSFSDSIANGFAAKDNETGFLADNCTKTAFRTNNGRFDVNGRGAFEAQSFAHQDVNAGAGTIDVSQRPISIITAPGEYGINYADTCPERFVRLLNTQKEGEVRLNGTFWTEYGIVSQVKVPYGRAMELYSNGICWYVINAAIG